MGPPAAVPPSGVPRPWRRRPRAAELLLDLWVLVPVVLLGLPLLTASGYPVARDLVFTPRLPLRPEALGLGTAAPRSAPLDAVVAVLSSVVDGAVLGRVAVLGGLALAGWGAHRLARGMPWVARAGVGALAVWNPFVVERLGLGQWALVLGYAVLWWAARAVLDPTPGAAARVAPWLALGALTPTSAVLTGATAVVLGAGRRGRARAESWVVAGLAAAVQLPWVVPALLGGATATSDPAGFAAFAARAEAPGPAVVSLLGLGGIWDVYSVPGTREGPLALVTAAVVVLALTGVALSPARRIVGPRGWALGLGSLVVAGVTSVPGAGEAVTRLAEVVPGLGLLRDAQKWLAPFVVLAVWAVGAAVARGWRVAHHRMPSARPGLAVLALALPFLLLPDGAVVVHRVLTPHRYPAETAAVARAVDGRGGLLVSAPWRLYHRYAWAGPDPTYDPASRLFDVRVVTDDRLVLGTGTVAGEDPLAARVGAALAGRDPATAVEALGVRWVLVTRGDPDAASLLAAVEAGSGVRRVVDGPDLVLLETADPAPVAVPAPPATAVAAVAATDLGVLLLLVVVSLRRGTPARRSRSVTVA